MLEVKDLHAWYGLSHVIQGISLEVGAGEVVALLGRNGAGKTTLLRSIMGLLGRTDGSIRFEGEEILGAPTFNRYHRGLAYVPEERRIVPGLSVRENLTLGMIASRVRIDADEAIAEVARTFPRLAQRLDQEGVSLSGGEQQMLAIARAMVARPKMILLDEPSEGIMPVLVDEMYDLFASLKASGTALLIVEQEVERALEVADRAYIIDNGMVAFSESAATLKANPEIQERYCSI
jgi:branched-chain amino acid transport system ATP-binding protein